MLVFGVADFYDTAGPLVKKPAFTAPLLPQERNTLALA